MEPGACKLNELLEAAALRRGLPVLQVEANQVCVKFVVCFNDSHAVNSLPALINAHKMLLHAFVVIRRPPLSHIQDQSAEVASHRLGLLSFLRVGSVDVTLNLGKYFSVEFQQSLF